MQARAQGGHRRSLEREIEREEDDRRLKDEAKRIRQAN